MDEPGVDSVVTDGDVGIVPNVGILAVFKHINYDPWFALAEFVDNALQSAIDHWQELEDIDPNFKLKVEITYEPAEQGRIIIVDNAAGIARTEFPRAFKAAELPKDRRGLSEFGMGMKSAAIWFARNWRVSTTSYGVPSAYTVEFDMDKVVADKVDRLVVQEERANITAHYTRVELWNLNQFMPGRTLGKVKDHLREIYRTFLRDGRLTLTVNGETLEYVDPDILEAPYFSSNVSVPTGKQRWFKEFSFSLGEDISVKGWAALRSEGRASNSGLSLFRRGRLITGTSDSPFKPVRIFGQANTFRSQRLFGEITIDGLPVSHTKDGFQWHEYQEPFEEKLREILDADALPLLKQAENYRARNPTRTELKRFHRAADKTVNAVGITLPKSMEGADLVLDEEPDEDDSTDYEQTFSFTHNETQWNVTVAAISNPSEARWLLRQHEVDPLSGSKSIKVTLNASHPFLLRFVLGNNDTIEAIYRIALALAVAETLMISAGDDATVARYLNHIDKLLHPGLSERDWNTQ